MTWPTPRLKVNCTVYCALFTVYCLLWTVYLIPARYNLAHPQAECELYYVLRTVYYVLCTVYCELYCVLCTIYCALFT
jgi:hypothetical protein